MAATASAPPIRIMSRAIGPFPVGAANCPDVARRGRRERREYRRGNPDDCLEVGHGAVLARNVDRHDVPADGQLELHVASTREVGRGEVAGRVVGSLVDRLGREGPVDRPVERASLDAIGHPGFEGPGSGRRTGVDDGERRLGVLLGSGRARRWARPTAQRWARPTARRWARPLGSTLGSTDGSTQARRWARPTARPTAQRSARPTARRSARPTAQR